MMSGMILSSRAFILSLRASFFFFMRWICSGSQPVADHGVDRGVEVGVILLELGVFQANFGLFLVRHGYRLQGFGRQKAPIRAGPEAKTTGAEPLSHFRQTGNATSVSIDF